MGQNTGNIVEFTIVYNRYKTRLYNFTLKMVSDRMVCDDIIQNVFMKLYQNLNRIKNKNSVLYWLFKTTRNEIYNYYRGRHIKVDQFNVADTDDIDVKADDNLVSEYEQRELKDMILSELSRMEKAQSEVYLLKEYGGLSYKEISTIMVIEENLVKSRLYKTRQKLVNRLEKFFKAVSNE